MIRNCVQLSRYFVRAGFFQSQTTVNIAEVGYITKRFAGHSKWANIKHTKTMKDRNKSMTFQRISQKVKAAVKEGGEDVNFNWKLKGLLEEAKRANMPIATFENAVKAAKTSQSAKPMWVIYTGPRGLIVAFEVCSNNIKHAQGKINQYSKKIDLKFEKQPGDFYEEKGVILCEPLKNVSDGLDKAMEDAIEVGIEEVMEDDEKMLIFECHPLKTDIAHKKLLEKGYNVHSASNELSFMSYITLKDDEIQAFNNVVDSLYRNFDELIRVSCNVEGL